MGREAVTNWCGGQDAMGNKYAQRGRFSAGHRRQRCLKSDRLSSAVKLACSGASNVALLVLTVLAFISKWVLSTLIYFRMVATQWATQ